MKEVKQQSGHLHVESEPIINNIATTADNDDTKEEDDIDVTLQKKMNRIRQNTFSALHLSQFNADSSDDEEETELLVGGRDSENSNICRLCDQAIPLMEWDDHKGTCIPISSGIQWYRNQ